MMERGGKDCEQVLDNKREKMKQTCWDRTKVPLRKKKVNVKGEKYCTAATGLDFLSLYLTANTDPFQCSHISLGRRHSSP